jgi:hypothetical protein
MQFEAAPNPERGIYRRWSLPSPPIEQRPFSQYEALLTDRAREGRAEFQQQRTQVQGCAIGMPLAMLTPTPIEFIRGDATINIRLAGHGVERVVHINDGAGVEPQPGRSALGHSTGYWDHDVLVIETRHVDWPYFDVSGTPLSDQVEFIERFSVSADDNRLTYKLTTIDRVMFRGPMTSEFHWDWIPEATINQFECGAGQEK